MAETLAPGLTADWLNGWLAALGVTVLLPESRLGWTRDGVPRGRFLSTADCPLPDAIAAALPSAEQLANFLIARQHPHASAQLPRNVGLEVYVERARLARRNGDLTFSACLTDLAVEREGGMYHSPFDPPAPQGITLHDRLLRCVEALSNRADIAADIAASLAGQGRRIEANGLGFDYRRLAAAAVDKELRVDPVVEILAFHGMLIFPARGNGKRAQVRGWTKAPTKRGAFSWPIWEPRLDRWAIDALLDRWYAAGRAAAPFGVSGAYQSVAFQAKSSSDVTRAYASERVW